MLFSIDISLCPVPGLYFELLALGLQMCVMVNLLAPLGGQLTTLSLLAEGQQVYAISPVRSSWALGACGVLSQYFNLNTERKAVLKARSPLFISEHQIWVFLLMFGSFHSLPLGLTAQRRFSCSRSFLVCDLKSTLCNTLEQKTHF